MKAVIFDMDGVLVDSEPHYLEQLNGFYKSQGAFVEKAFLHAIIGSSYEHTYKESIKAMEKDWDIQTFTNKFEVYVEDHGFSYDEILNPGVKDILVYLKQHGYKCAIASSSRLDQIQTMVRVCFLQEYFDTLLSGEMFTESKPNPEIYLSAAHKLNVDPSECLVVEDSFYGITAGIAAGMHVIAYRDERFGVDQSKAHTMIDNLSQIQDVLKTLE